MKKAEFSLANFVIGLLLFSMIVTVFYIVPQQANGFWPAYSYNPSLEMSKYDVSKNASRIVENMACDITQEPGCNSGKKSVIGAGKSVIETMVGGVYGALVFVYNGFGITKVLFESIGSAIGVDPIIVTTFTAIILFSVVFALLLLIFNRS